MNSPRHTLIQRKWQIIYEPTNIWRGCVGSSCWKRERLAVFRIRDCSSAVFERIEGGRAAAVARQESRAEEQEDRPALMHVANSTWAKWGRRRPTSDEPGRRRRKVVENLLLLLQVDDDRQKKSGCRYDSLLRCRHAKRASSSTMDRGPKWRYELSDCCRVL